MRAIAVSNEKGGAGKTTVAVGLAVGLQKAGHRVLLVDVDGQGHSTTWLLPGLPKGVRGTPGVLESGEAPPDEELLPVPGREGLFVLASTRAMDRAAALIRQEPGGDLMLRQALEGLRGRFDYVVIDCPPSLGTLTCNALTAADGVLVPVPSAYLALHGLALHDVTVEKVRARTNAQLRMLGYLHNFVDSREAISREARELLREGRGSLLLRAELRVSTKQKGIAAHRLTAWDKGADERGLEDWRQLLPEVLERLHGAPTGEVLQ